MKLLKKRFAVLIFGDKPSSLMPAMEKDLDIPESVIALS